MQLRGRGRGSLRNPLLCTLVALAVVAGALPAARLEGDDLSVTIANRQYRVTLGSPHLLREPSAGQEGAWRRQGAHETVLAAVILRGSGQELRLSHVGLLTRSGVWQLREGADALQEDMGQAGLSFRWAPAARRLFAWSGTRFDGCWPGDDETLMEVKIGFACDQGYVEATGGSRDTALKEIEEMLSMANLVYENQLSVHLSLGEVLMPNQWPGHLSSSERPCKQAIDARLNEFQAIARNSLAGHRMAAFVQLTDCYRPKFGFFGSKEIGVACVGTLCNPVHNYAVVSYNRHTWLTFAHELGHIFGAQHAFEDGKGTTGGIMDYGDGRWKGAYQFHPYNEKEICGFISRSMTKPRLYELSDCWRSFVPNATVLGHWSDGDWSNCSILCAFNGGERGLQQRRPLCLDYRGGIQPDDKCLAHERPKEVSKPCQPNLEPCYSAARWVYAAWEDCVSPLNLSCGAGRQERRAHCHGQDGRPRPADHCPHPAPAPDIRGCSLRRCERDAVWAQGSYWRSGPECSNEAAYQVRELQCTDTATLQPANAQRCPLAKPLPDFRRIRAPACPSLQDSCCLDAACHRYRVDRDCLLEGPHLHAVSCVMSPSGSRWLFAALGSSLRWGGDCELARPRGSYAALQESFLGLPMGWISIDAIVAGPASSSELLIFRGKELLRFSLEAAAAFSGYPRPTAQEFDGLSEVCGKCVSRVTAGLFDEDTETLRLWCGYGEVYCLSRRPWRAVTRPGDWILRPSQDLGVPAIRGVLKERTPGITVLLANGSRCNVRDEQAICSSKPLPYFAGGAPGSPRCSRHAFCADCADDECRTCEPGFELSWGRCVPFTARLWVDFPHKGGSTEATLGRHGVVDIAELAGSRHVPGPFIGSTAIRADSPLHMAPVLDERGRVALMRRWSLTAWVRARKKASGRVLFARQSHGGLLLMNWESCGPSVEYQSEGDTLWQLPCDEHLASALTDEEWVRMGVDFQYGSVVLRVYDREVRREVEDLKPMSLGDWRLGGADIDVGLLQVLDHEKWPRIHVGTRRSTLPLIIAALLVCVLGAGLTRCAWQLKPPEGMVFVDQGWLASLAEAYVNVASTALALLGIVVTGSVFMLLAFGPTGGHIGLWDLMVGLTSGELAVALLPLAVGLVLFAAGIAGIRMARTRDCCWILAYVFWMLFSLRLQYTVLVYLDAIDPHFQRPALASLTDSALLQEVDSDFQSNGQQPLLREIQETFVHLMSRANYDCSLVDDRQASCGAVTAGAVIRCSQPYATARAFEELVNSKCSLGADSNLCSSCIEGFGRLAGAPDWDPRQPASRIFCKCASNLVTSTKGWARRLGQFCRGLGIAEVVFLVSVLYLACVAPDRSELLMQHISLGRVQQAPAAVVILRSSRG